MYDGGDAMIGRSMKAEGDSVPMVEVSVEA